MTAPIPAPAPAKKTAAWLTTVEKAVAVFAAVEAPIIGVTGFHWVPLAGASVAAAVTVVNEVIPTGPFTALIDAALGALGHFIPAAKTKVATRKAERS